jgi:hypothetical protein
VTVHTVSQRLQEAQRAIAQRNDPDWPVEESERLLFVEAGGLFHLDFYGSPFGASFDEFLGLLGVDEVATRIRSFVLRGPDEGANGTRNWDLTRLVERDVRFPELISLFIEPTLPEHHNQTVVAQTYDEDGMITRLLEKTPRLQSLTVPRLRMPPSSR